MDLSIGACVQNISKLRLHLWNRTSLSFETIENILAANFTMSKISAGALATILTGRCDEETLKLILSFPTDRNISNTVQEFCTLSSKDLYSLFVTVSQYFDIRSIIYKGFIPVVMPVKINQIMSHVLDMFSSIAVLTSKARPIIRRLPELLGSLSNLELPGVLQFQEALAGTALRVSSASSWHRMSKMVCKQEVPAMLAESIMLSELPQVTKLTTEDIQKYGIPSNSTDFCMEFYQDILQSPSGALLWTFLKPLLQGKILYFPQTAATQEVLGKANATFEYVKKLKTYAEAWLRASDMLGKKESILMINQLQGAFQNNFVQSFIESQLNIDLDMLSAELQAYGNAINKTLSDPATEQINLLSQLMVNISACVSLDRFSGFDSLAEMERNAQELMQQNNFLASVIFNLSGSQESPSPPPGSLPPHLSYTIRTSVLHSMRTDQLQNPVWAVHPKSVPMASFRYNRVFVPLQDMIERAIIAVQTGRDVSDTQSIVQAMPYPCHIQDQFMSSVGFFLPLLMMLSWMISLASMVRKLVFEREMQLEVYLEMMGVQPATHIAAWFADNVILLATSSALLVLISKLGGILPHSDSLLLYLFLLDFGVSIITFSFLISVFFSNANVAAMGASLLYTITFFPFMILVVVQAQLSFSAQSLVCLLSTTAFSQGVYCLTFLENNRKGVQWNNMYYTPSDREALSFGWMCWMMLIDSFLYFVLGWYFHKIFPAPRGGEQNSLRGCDADVCRAGVFLSSVTKEFKGCKAGGVRGLNLTFCRGHITSLLGPNGAGKSTTISLVTGLHQPNSGTVFVNGTGTHQDLCAVRKEMGVCLQQDVLFHCLTVREHLLLYSAIKAPHWGKTRLTQEVNRALEESGLSPHQHNQVTVLSGGTKRKLSIAIAFIGDSNTIVLDEPTSGVDPSSRRGIWSLLLKYRAGHTIILTTHHLEEAANLSDRIVILDKGQLKCWGSPAYLKEVYGRSCSLTLVTANSLSEQDSFYAEHAVTSLVKCQIPEAFLKDHFGGELTYLIPATVEKSKYSRLFQTLDANMENLHLIGYGISDNTFEEALLRLLQDPHSTDHAHSPDVEAFNVSGIKPINSDGLTRPSRDTGAPLCLRQITALLIKRFHHCQRDWKGSWANLLLPVIFVTMAMALFTVKPLVIDYPSLRLTPQMYNSSEGWFFRVHSSCQQFSSGVLDYSHDSCDCEKGQQQECPVSNASVPFLMNNKGEVLCNLTGYHVEKFLTRATKTLFGGWSFGLKFPSEFKHDTVNSSSVKTMSKVWYNQQGYHAEPSFLNQLNNFILWSHLPPANNWTQYRITLNSHPYGGAFLDEDRIQESIRQCGVALCVLLGFSILGASLGTAVVRDRVSGQKRLQHVSGLGHSTYWSSNFLFDMVFYLLTVTLCICVFAAFQLTAFTFRDNLAATALLLALFGFSTLPWMYLMSRWFSSPDVAFIAYISVNFVLGFGTVFLTFLPRFLALISHQENLQKMYDTLRWAFILLPQFCLGQGLIELSYNQMKFDLTHRFGIDSYVSPFRMNFLGWIFVSMAIQGCLFLSLRLWLNWDLVEQQRSEQFVPEALDQSEDEDVTAEQHRVLSGKLGSDVLVLRNLKKHYRQSKAVNGISLGVSRGECFGLLGVNGAGKTTTFKMLTGDLRPSSGHAIVRTTQGTELEIRTASSAGKLIGYCPQSDALDDYLTGWEHFYYYSRLKGIPEGYIKEISHSLIVRLNLTAHANKLVGTYSGGTKRKLSTALALIGKPQVLLLDEPSSGMDPVSKRYLWRVILKELRGGCAAVLTSHSLEECEALCTRLAVMVNGKFKCLGSPQHIKNRFGGGYSAKVWLSKDSSDAKALTHLLTSHFPGTYLKEQHLGLIEYQVPQREGCLSDIFRLLEENRESLQIKNYSISQATLHQVFTELTLQQEESAHQDPLRHQHMRV
ncbi:ATP-binding cassette sub-family A member 13-like [Amia ocellicauda]|uniref:ATP-binding cassette sub-family A member 13-like n=1 Tax=Amia ocellicauda TaxID=2972642 RepID=UPI003463A3CF